MQQLPDTPIFSPEQDLFSLSPFSQRLARVLRTAQARENMVVGLNGVWGGGKTSVLNMAVAWLMAMEKAGLDRYAASERDEIQAMDTLIGRVHPDDHARHLTALEREWGGSAGGQTVIVRYNPWLASGHDTLVSDFFRVLGDRLDEVLDDEIRLYIRATASRLADFMDLTRQSSSGMGRLLALYAEASGGGPLADKQEGAKRTGFLKGLFRKVTATPIPETLQEARDQLAAQLDKLKNCRILVVIEDIDRLRPDEVRSLLSMMKAIGQLPNITYLIGYDRSVLEKALGEDGDENGLPKFLEKIVQVDLDLPRVPGERLLEALLAHAGDIFGAPLDANERQDLMQTFKRRRVLLTTPRDVGRLRNALVFADAATGRSIRTTDLMRMEMLRLKERDVFDWIMRHAIYFHPRIGMSTADVNAEDRAFIEAGIAQASKINRDAVADTLAHTFENVAQALGGAAPDPKDRLHELDTRYPLYSWEGWECYLQSFPNTDVIAQEEWGYVRQIGSDLPKARNYVQTLLSRRRSDGKPLLLSFLDGLDRLLPGGPEPVGLLTALLELDDTTVSTGFGMTHQSAFRELHRLFARCEHPVEVLTGLTLKEGVNPFAVLIVLEVFAEQLGLMTKGKSREPCVFSENDLVESISTVYLRMSSVPAERSAEWFSTVDMHRLLSLGLDRKTLLQFIQKALSKSAEQLRYLLEEVCTNWPSRHGVRLLLTRRPEPDVYPLQDMRNYAARMARKYPDDDFFHDFVEGADEFLATPGLKDRSQRLKM